jgi:hypothetical protein
LGSHNRVSNFIGFLGRIERIGGKAQFERYNISEAFLRICCNTDPGCPAQARARHTSDPFVIRGLDPRIAVGREIAGSSPAMTGESKVREGMIAALLRTSIFFLAGLDGSYLTGESNDCPYTDQHQFFLRHHRA